jgi:glyoxylase-like metal-dependent hydrolase (beta-lactamase superfamily II)
MWSATKKAWKLSWSTGEVTTTMIDQIENKAYSLKAALITHSHIHTAGTQSSHAHLRSVVYASNTKLFNIACKKPQDQQVFQEASFSIRAIAVPGHSQDSIVYDIDGCLFTGDAFHAGIIGKTTSAFNAKALYERLNLKLEHYPDDSLVFPGHGPPSTLGTEKKFNLGLREGFAESLKTSYDFFV